MRTSSYSTQILIMEIIKESYCRSRFALFGCNVAIRRKVKDDALENRAGCL